jgi:hypothetical protein
MSLSVLLFDSARVPSTLTERDYTIKDGESRTTMTRGFMKVLAALFSYWAAPACRRKTTNSSLFGSRAALRSLLKNRNDWVCLG